METPAQGVSRLLTALEILAAREDIQVAAGDPAGILQTQQLFATVIERLAQLGAGAADEAARTRLAALRRQRERTQDAIGARMERVRAELSRVTASRQHLALVAPAYTGRSYGTPPGGRVRWMQRA